MLADINVKVLTDAQNVETLSSDIVVLDTNNDYVVLNFLQILPGGNSTIPDEGKVVDRSAKVATRVSLSWGHFINLIPQFMEFAKKNEEFINNRYKNTSNSLKNMTVNKK
jgi:hypothetical protein